jgi:L,D-transpeptidase catalytic domain
VRRRAVVGALLLAAAAVVGLVKVVDQVGGKAAGSSHPADRWSTDAVEELPRPPRPAFTVSRPMLLDRGESRARFAPVVRTVEARALPRRDSAPVALLPHETEERTTNIVLVLGEARADRGTWVHVRLPVLPNDRTAWVPRSTLGGYEFVDTRLVVDLARFTATLLRDGRPVFRTVVGVGQTAWPTPKGAFYIRDRVTDFDDPFYGPIAFGTSARSPVLTDWPGGGFVGIHGTNQPELIPGRISHGCIRMRNEDIVRLARLMPVGTPLTIR